jgi:hypothetical protein
MIRIGILVKNLRGFKYGKAPYGAPTIYNNYFN